MERQAFISPVRIEFGRGGSTCTVGSLQDAAELLMNEDWPAHGPLHRAACKACIEALENGRTLDEARQAFVDAAREADILVCPWSQ